MKAFLRAGERSDPFMRYRIARPAGSIIYSEGEIGTEMFTIQSGKVEIVKALGSEVRILAALEKGDFFGEMSLLDGLPRADTARAETDVDLVRIDGALLDSMLRGNPEIAVRMMKKLSRKLREAMRMVETGPAGPAAPADGARRAAAAHDGPLCVLVSADGKTEFPLSREGDTLIGRSDPVTGMTPDVDLTPLDSQRVAARRHARIYSLMGGFFLMEEIGVVSGTFVNDIRLTTGSPVALRDGDVVKFGLVPLTFLQPAA